MDIEAPVCLFTLQTTHNSKINTGYVMISITLVECWRRVREIPGYPSDRVLASSAGDPGLA